MQSVDKKSRKYSATLAPVYNRGRPTAAFLDPLLDWAINAPDEIFAPNNVPVDIFTVIKSSLATTMRNDSAGTPTYQWGSLLHRKAALLEAMRVHGVFESSGNWKEGVDRTNKTSMRNLERQETGAFQVSFDSTRLGSGAMKPFAKTRGIDTAFVFISAMKKDPWLACEYYARLVRVSICWAGPLLRHGEDSIYPWLRRSAVTEFMGFLS